MTQISLPYVDLRIEGATNFVQNDAQKILFVNQKTASGTAIAGDLYENCGRTANTLFGEDSLLATTIRSFFKINPINRVDAISLDDSGSGIAATGNITFSGTAATEDGKYSFYIGSKRNNIYEVNVLSGETPDNIGAKVIAKINGDTTSLVSSTNTNGDVGLTTKNKGEEGNYLTIGIYGTVAGITVAVTQMSGGASNPTLTGIFDAAQEDRYQAVIWPATYDITELQTFLDNRFNFANRVLNGVGFISKTGTLGQLNSYGFALNDKNLCVHGNKAISSTTLGKLRAGSAIAELDTALIAQFAAIRSLRLTQGYPIGDFVSTATLSPDSFGGRRTASIPYHEMPFDLLPTIEKEDEWSSDDVTELNSNGVFVLGNNLSRTGIVSGEVVTTYRENEYGEDDPSFKYLNQVDSLSEMREYYFYNLKQYKQYRLTNGSFLGEGNNSNADTFFHECKKLYKDMISDQIVKGGIDENTGINYEKLYEDNLHVSVDTLTRSVEMQMIAPLTSQLSSIYGVIRLTI